MGHVWHCLNYIRQNVLCSPDLSLEPGDFEERNFEVDRNNGIHVCRDWDQIYRFMNDNLLDFNQRVYGGGKFSGL